MSYYGGQPNHNPYAAPGSGAQNLQFYPSTYSPAIPGSQTPQASAAYGYGGPGPGPGAASSGGYGVGAQSGFASAGFGGAGVSGRMGEQGGLRTGWIAAFSTEGYDGEPPLLAELGVNFEHIQNKVSPHPLPCRLRGSKTLTQGASQTLAVLNPFKNVDRHIMDDSDLGGPLIFFLLYGTFLLFSGKVHFGYIYGLALLGSVSLHLILSLMSPAEDPAATQAYPQYSDPSSSQAPHDQGPRGGDGGGGGGHFSPTLTFSRSASVLGYCLLPLVATSLFGIVVPMDTSVGILVTSLAILWCTYSASGFFVVVGRMRGMRFLVAYPLALFYVGFGIMGIFSSRGAGSLANAAAKLNG
ncbi:Protein transport protein yip1 [Escovopsis weberi]|uniref:Protein YIP n=1 Tax=Escovopsis weberi TaxID=150374 RepID=A0A0M8N3I6_ESCWE|nr:Protein transport protein yip1 [Escovopsis weberi]